MNNCNLYRVFFIKSCQPKYSLCVNIKNIILYFAVSRRIIVRNKFISIVLSYLFIHLAVFAESIDTYTTNISVEVGKDEQNNTNSLVSADMGLSNSKRIFFGVGKSKIPSGADTIDSNLAFVGLSKKHSDDWKLTGSLEYSGLRNAYTMFSTSAGVRYNQNNYYLELVPAIRSISLTTTTNKHLIISSGALGLKTGVYLGDHFRLSGSAYSYNYSRDVRQSASFTSSRFFNVETLLLSSGLLKKYYNLETGLDFYSFSVSLGKNSSVSAIDNSNSDYIYSVVDYSITGAWRVSILFGEYLNTPADQNNYSSLTVSYSF